MTWNMLAIHKKGVHTRNVLSTQRKRVLLTGERKMYGIR